MPTRTFDFRRILQTLAAHRVEFIVVGGVSAVLQGVPINTFDLDLVHSRTSDNLDRLLEALEELDAYYREPGDRRLRPQRAVLACPGHNLLTTSAGSLDLLGTVSSNLDYVDLLPHTIEVSVDLDLCIRLLELAKLIEIKEETGREKDKAVLPILRRTLQEKMKQ
jgi:hypothetical protein